MKLSWGLVAALGMLYAMPCLGQTDRPLNNQRIREKHEYAKLRAKLTRIAKELERTLPGVDNPANFIRGKDLVRYDQESDVEFKSRQDEQDRTYEAIKAYREARKTLWPNKEKK